MSFLLFFSLASLHSFLPSGPPPRAPVQQAAQTPAFCFAPGTPQTVMDRYARRGPSDTLTTSFTPAGFQKFQFTDSARWSSTATNGSGLGQGDPTVLTWSIVPDGTLLGSGANESNSGSDLIATLNAVYGNQGARGDVRIGGHSIDGVAGVLGYNYYPDVGDMVIDTDETFFSNLSENSIRLRNLIAHELGHAMGIDHVCPLDQTKLMEPILTTSIDGPQDDDILAANRGYGDRAESNDASGLAFPILAEQSLGQLSIDDNSDVDYFRFNLSGNDSVSAVLTPLGDTYPSGPESGSACTPGIPVNTLTRQNLELRILDSDGSTVLASSVTGGYGAPESLNNVSLGGAGEYYLLVEGSGQNHAQRYALALSTQGAPTNTLSVESSGGGQGTVHTSPAGIHCGPTCSAPFPAGESVQLSATPAEGSLFASWSGDPDCFDGVVTMSSAKHCVATFTLEWVPWHLLSVGAIDGTVESSPAGIDCPDSSCSEVYIQGTVVTLTATPDPGRVLGEWVGDPDCIDGVVTMTADTSCTPNFIPIPPNTKTLSVSTSHGSVESSPIGILCPNSSCVEQFPQGTAVTLQAYPEPGYSFAGWSGDSDCSDGHVTMSQNLTCHANFSSASASSSLVLNVVGPGSVSYTPSSPNCSGTCTTQYPNGTYVDLTPLPGPGATFVGFTGNSDCSDGTLLMSADRTCTATFSSIQTHTLTVTRDGAGYGLVETMDGYVHCGADCSESYPHNAPTELLAIPNNDSFFIGFSGHPDCSDRLLTMTSDRYCVAHFSLNPLYSNLLEIRKTGTGTGLVTATGIHCGNDCSEVYGEVLVTLVVQPDSGSVFRGFTGDPDCGDFQVAMNQDHHCVARFEDPALVVSEDSFEQGNLSGWSSATN